MSYISNQEKFVIDASGQISSSQIETDAVTTSKILNGAVTNDKRGISNYSITSGSSTTLTTSYTTIYSTTITTNGRPVFISLVPSSPSLTGNIQVNSTSTTSASSISASFKILRDGITLGLFNVGVDKVPTAAADTFTFYMPLSSILYLDEGASAGSHTYTVQGLYSNGSVGYVSYAKLVVFEL